MQRLVNIVAIRKLRKLVVNIASLLLKNFKRFRNYNLTYNSLVNNCNYGIAKN